MTLEAGFHGRLTYLAHEVIGPHRLLLAIPCIVADLEESTTALVDTASEWCVLGSDLVRLLGKRPLAETVILTRFGALAGALERFELPFSASHGERLTVDATWFVSEEWPGPTVIGWRGALERIRFAVDPADESFYFGEI